MSGGASSPLDSLNRKCISKALFSYSCFEFVRSIAFSFPKSRYYYKCESLFFLAPHSHPTPSVPTFELLALHYCVIERRFGVKLNSKKAVDSFDFSQNVISRGFFIRHLRTGR
ncbi:hypothetical protein TNCT_712991 [Trichonephila clavata]|uniref:Uncharacterized protein n=1 Tax=Trichonephila clavata TaxID=2740835 RepID=A0A8X6H117_TRICU|nr:hypothetical protein TNCT_712991 [Trichonephila clavata]